VSALEQTFEGIPVSRLKRGIARRASVTSLDPIIFASSSPSFSRVASSRAAVAADILVATMLVFARSSG
jgi:hypothetical protein